MAKFPSKSIPKKQLQQLHDRCAEHCDESMDMILCEVMNQKKDNHCSAMLHILISQNMGQTLDMYIELYGREVAEQHFDLILNTRLRAAVARDHGQSAFLD